MDVDNPEADPHEPMGFNKTHDLILAGDACLRKRAEVAQDFRPFKNIPASQLPYDEGMTSDLTFVEQKRKLGIPIIKMIDPYRGVDENHRLYGASPAGDGAEIFLGPAEPGPSLGALPGDQVFQAHPDQRRLLFDPGQLGSPGEEFVVNVDRRSHMHIYAIYMHICQALPSCSSQY